jgi:hypothetical protein
MKHGVTLLILITAGIVIVQTLLLLGVPLWLPIMILPLLAYGQIYALNRYTFRDSLDFEMIPEKGYQKRREALDLKKNELAELGFINFDEFYLRLSNDVIAYIYRHQAEPIYFCHYHLGTMEFYDLVTKFDNGFSLTTADSKNAGSIPRPKNKMLQIFEGREIEELLHHHLEAVKFLESQGFKTSPLYLSNFRSDFLNSFLEVGREVRGVFAPPKLIYWMVSGVSQNYCKSVQQQYLAKKLLLP